MLRFSAVRGIYELCFRIALMRPSIMQSEFWRLVIDVQRRHAGLDDIISPTIPKASTRTSPHFGALVTNFDPDESSSRIKVYHGSMTILEWIYDAMVNLDSPVESNMRWRFQFCLLPEQLMSLLQNQDDRALVIFAHCICLETCPDLALTWWVTPHVAPMVQALADLVHPDWAWAMEWPLSVAHGETDVRSSPVLKYEAYRKRLAEDAFISTEGNRLPDRSA